MATFPLSARQVLWPAGPTLLALALHCGGPSNSDSLQYSRPTIVAAVGEAIPPDQPLAGNSAGPPYEVSPALPEGVTLDADTGVLAGTPTASSPRASYEVTAGHGAGAQTTRFVLTVLEAGTPLHRVLACPDVPQKTGYWCWAASATSILNYFGFPVTQDVVAGNHENDQNDFFLPAVLASYGHPGTWGPVLVFPEVKAQISAGNPFVLNIGLGPGGAITHDVVGFGFDIRDGLDVMWVMDPADTDGLGDIYQSTYAWVVNGPGNHFWLKTFTFDP